MTYLEAWLTHQTPDMRYKRLLSHFFKPYENLTAFTEGLFYPVESLFEETLPSLVLSLHFIGQALFSTTQTLGFFLLADKTKTIEAGRNTCNVLLMSALTIINAVLAPIFEAIRFFTRWGASIAENLHHQEMSYR